MTDNEIIKALELCGNIDVSCKGCVFVNCELCRVKLAENAYILINRQQAEIETQSQNFKMLVSDHRCLQQSFDNLKGLYQAEKEKIESAKSKSIYFAKELQKARAEIERLMAEAECAEGYAEALKERAKSEAIKEFAENCKKGLRTGEIIMDKSIRDIIDNLVKEMVGEDK